MPSRKEGSIARPAVARLVFPRLVLRAQTSSHVARPHHAPQPQRCAVADTEHRNRYNKQRRTCRRARPIGREDPRHHPSANRRPCPHGREPTPARRRTLERTGGHAGEARRMQHRQHWRTRRYHNTSHRLHDDVCVSDTQIRVCRHSRMRPESKLNLFKVPNAFAARPRAPLRAPHTHTVQAHVRANASERAQSNAPERASHVSGDVQRCRGKCVLLQACGTSASHRPRRHRGSGDQRADRFRSRRRGSQECPNLFTMTPKGGPWD